MEYKVLIKLFVPEIEEIYEAYIPINLTVGEVSRFLNQLVNNASGVYPIKDNISIYNRRSGVLYIKDSLVRNTDIRNGTELVMISGD
ncbi:hypothetical protein IKD82_01840 [Candidatus Saccharibacteria bacterium]|nr:hypothetical protein [Candidatus Saccharibacteria bacterium]